MALPIHENRVQLTDADGKQLVIAERTSLRLTATLLDETGAAIPSAGLSTLKLTLYNRDSLTKEIINTVTQVNILNTGRGTVHASSGLLTLTLDPADNQIIDDTQDQEWHRALIEGTYAAGVKAFKAEIDFPVRNLNKVS
ncbi:MAG: hypothetical protein AAB217_22530 [Chloroflexota bacterium]|jgi:hypothetical protein